MFLQTNDRIINLKNVSNINIIKETNRIVFNLNYNIEITYFDKFTKTEKRKFISDYVYWDAINSENLKQNLSYLMEDSYFKNNFIKQIEDSGFINYNYISSIKFSEKKNRVIFNLSHPITFIDGDGKEKITSEFVYVNCSDFNQYKDYVLYVKKEINLYRGI